MDTLLSFLVDWGYWGMLVASFLAGSFFPFSSEAVMLALQAAGLEPASARDICNNRQCVRILLQLWGRTIR